MTRRSNRLEVNVDAELITDDTRIAGVLTSISADCVCIETFSGNVEIDLSPGNLFHVEFKTESGETLLLFCSVIWSKKITSEAGPITTCLRLQETSPEFETYFKAIFSRNEGIV